VALNAPKPDEAPSGMRGNRDEAMTVNNVNRMRAEPLRADQVRAVADAKL